jgi:hypothetical protein
VDINYFPFRTVSDLAFLYKHSFAPNGGSKFIKTSQKKSGWCRAARKGNARPSVCAGRAYKVGTLALIRAHATPHAGLGLILLPFRGNISFDTRDGAWAFLPTKCWSCGMMLPRIITGAAKIAFEKIPGRSPSGVSRWIISGHARFQMLIPIMQALSIDPSGHPPFPCRN